jgi:hypothetical protein
MHGRRGMMYQCREWPRVTISSDQPDCWSMLWVLLALVVGVVGGIAVAMRRYYVSSDFASEIDAGTVSDSWLAEQRGNKPD